MTPQEALSDQKKSFDAALMSIGFLMEVTGRVQWNCGGGRGPWEGCLAALVLAREPGLKTRRLVEALPAEKHMDRVGLLNVMANLGYFSGSVEAELGDIEPRLMPCLFVPAGRENDPQVVLTRDEDKLTIYNGGRHQIDTISATEAAAARRGTVFFFPRFDPHRQQLSKFMREGTGRTWFGALIRRFSGTMGQILITCFALNFFALAPAIFVMMAYDRVISPSDLSALPALTVGVGIALFAEYILRNVRSEGLAWMTARLDNIVGSRIFSHLIGLSPELIEQASVAAQVARIKTFESVRDFFSSSVFLSFLEIPFIVMAAGVMAAIAGPLVFVPLMMIGAYAGLFFLMRHYIKTAIRLAAKSSSARQQFSIETFEKLRFVRMNGLTAAWARKFADLQGREILMNFHLGFLGTVAETLANALTILAAVFTIGYGAHLIWTGAMTTGALVASMILVWRILLPFYSLCTMIPRLEQLRNSVLQVNSLMDLESEADRNATAVLPSLRGNLTLENVVMAYNESADPVIEGLTANLKAGGILAVTGRNGSGKTSLLKLVKGLYRPQTGTVRLDGFDIRQLDAADLRRQIAYVPQKADFFPGTIAENLVIGNLFATAEEIEKALRLADAWDEVNALREGIHADLDKSQISVHLAAKLSLARAYLQNAPVLLVDELPNAVLNGQAGRNLKQYLLLGKGQRSVVLVTHRNDLLDVADSIVHLRRGETPKVGLRDELIHLIREAA